MKFAGLTTEMRNKASMDIDKKSTFEMLQIINEEDKKVAYAVENVLEDVAYAVDLIYKALKSGGRLFYVGAGTSGRIGIMDSSECVPTFMVSEDLIQTIMAGGKQAIMHAVEGAEDNEYQGGLDVIERKVTDKDVVIGITASGRTPYPIGALKEAQSIGAHTISLTCNKAAMISKHADCSIEVIVGPEILTGSTRMKAATSHKMILNMISTSVMIKLGKVYENLMVDVNANNVKLKERAKRIVMDITNSTYEEAEEVLEKTGYQVKVAVVMMLTQTSYEQAKYSLLEHKGYVREAIQSL